MKKLVATVAFAFVAAGLAACDDATIVSQNLSKAADNFEIMRRIVFINGITDKYLLVIEGRCSLQESKTAMVAVVCKTGPDEYKKHFLGKGDNVFFVAEQIESAEASAYHYRVTFKPQVLIPDVNVRMKNEGIDK